MSPNSPPSSLCCCSRYFRRSAQPLPVVPPPKVADRSNIEMKVNGLSLNTTDNVAIKASGHTMQSSATELSVDVFETARTSRDSMERKHFPMVELIRMVRIEEGLEVTPRTDNLIPEQHDDIPRIIHKKVDYKARRAVFNEEGDITARSSFSRNINTVSMSVSHYLNGISSSGLENFHHDTTDTYSNRELPFPQPVLNIASIDGNSVASANGEEARKVNILEKELKKGIKKNLAARVCLKKCQEKGVNCPAGPAGPPGKQGKGGMPGVPGINGTKGASGIAVAVAGGCIKCPTGRRGARGKSGIPGKKGKDGKDGLTVKAVVGMSGPMGDMGYPGYPGFPGERGVPGPLGKKFKRYLNPAGPIGFPGREGYQGAQGPSGFVYNTALVGPIGVSGRNGQNGRNGSTGRVGSVGHPGRDGNYCECPPKSKRNPFKSV